MTSDIERIDRYLRGVIDSLRCRVNPKLLSAIEYSLFPGGKRIRPILTIRMFESVGGMGDSILPYACALEMVHTSSLIKDDLPAMDNHKERRGKPTLWMVYGESTALLVADLLNNESTRILASQPEKYPLIEILNACVSMIDGQNLDRRGIKSSEVNKLKTASLFEACTTIGCIVGGGTPEQISEARNYGYKFGMEFQLKDDITDKDGLYAVSY